MTENKQIIIDGVNIAGCEFHSSTLCSELCYMKGNKCNDNPNCLFKQLARKTQECEILQQSENEEKEIIAELEAKNKQAEQKFGRIKTLNPHTGTFMEYRIEIQRIIDEEE